MTALAMGRCRIQDDGIGDRKGVAVRMTTGGDEILALFSGELDGKSSLRLHHGEQLQETLYWSDDPD